jgi:hypothetical protein
MLQIIHIYYFEIPKFKVRSEENAITDPYFEAKKMNLFSIPQISFQF